MNPLSTFRRLAATAALASTLGISALPPAVAQDKMHGERMSDKMAKGKKESSKMMAGSMRAAGGHAKAKPAANKMVRMGKTGKMDKMDKMGKMGKMQHGKMAGDRMGHDTQKGKM